MDMESSRIRRVSALVWMRSVVRFCESEGRGKSIRSWNRHRNHSDFNGSKDGCSRFYSVRDPGRKRRYGKTQCCDNHLEDKIKVITGDIRDASNMFGASSFHVITTNPPYMIGTHGENSPSTAKAIARHEVLCTLDDILRESARLLMPGGRFYMVHRPFRLAEIMSKMVEYKIEPKRMRLVYPYIDKEPNMVLIEGLRGGKSRVTVEKPLIVYKEQGVYTDEIYDIYGY